MSKGIFWTKIAICALVTYVNWYLHTVIILVTFLCVFVLFWLWCMERIVFLSWVCELLIRQTVTTIVASECSKYSHMRKKCSTRLSWKWRASKTVLNNYRTAYSVHKSHLTLRFSKLWCWVWFSRSWGQPRSVRLWCSLETSWGRKSRSRYM